MTASDLRGRLSAAKVGQFFNICVDAIIHAERLEAENKRLREALADIVAYDNVALTNDRAADHAVCTARAALEGADNDSR